MTQENHLKAILKKCVLRTDLKTQRFSLSRFSPVSSVFSSVMSMKGHTIHNALQHLCGGRKLDHLKHYWVFSRHKSKHDLIWWPQTNLAPVIPFGFSNGAETNLQLKRGLNYWIKIRCFTCLPIVQNLLKLSACIIPAAFDWFLKSSVFEECVLILY